MPVSRNSRRAIVGVCLLLAASLSSCGGGGGGGGDGGVEDQDFAVRLTMRGANGAETSNFTFGNSIVFDITITNRSAGTQVLTLPSSQIYDLALFDEGAQSPRWRWSFNRTFTPVATNLSFTGQQSVTYLFIWNGVLEDGTQLMPGSYEVQGILAYPQYASDWRSNDELATGVRRIHVTN